MMLCPAQQQQQLDCTSRLIDYSTQPKSPLAVCGVFVTYERHRLTHQQANQLNNNGGQAREFILPTESYYARPA
jgi:hypothetical protein